MLYRYPKGFKIFFQFDSYSVVLLFQLKSSLCRPFRVICIVCVGDVVCNGGDSCCSVSSPCKEGEGDCDSNLHCEGDLLCGANNCDINNPGFDTTDDCCFRPTAPDTTAEPTETPISTISTTTTTATSSTNGLTLGKREINFEEETSNK